MIRPKSLPARRLVSPGKPRRDQRELSCRPVSSAPCLRLSPTAWAKLLFMRDAGDTEVGGFGISTADDLLLIEDFQLVRQTCDVASVSFDDTSVADFFDRQIDAGRKPQQVGRIWVHTHPGTCPQPSQTDEDTFARVFCLADWAVMFVVARGGDSFARLQFNVGPKGNMNLPVEVDYSRPFSASDHAAWQEEYLANVEAFAWPPQPGAGVQSASEVWNDWGFFDELFDDDPGFAPHSTERPLDHDF